MSGVNVLDFVTRELEGRVLTVSSVSAFVAAEKAADNLGMTATSREAAELAVLLPKAPLEGIRDEFGSVTADIVEELRAKSPYSSVAIEAMALHARSGNDGNRRDAAIASCASEVAVASPENRKPMAEMLDFMADRETDAERSTFIRDLRAQLSDPDPADPQRKSHRPSKVLSVSMDVCGSTEAKAKMRAYARNDQELHGWYDEFNRQFLSLEWRFHTQLFQAIQGEIEWDWRHAFVVKGIGDEIWLLYEVPEDDLWKLPSLVARLLNAALTVTNCPIHWTSAPEDLDECAAGTWQTARLPLKFYVDILEDAFEVSGPRRDFVTERLPEILGAEEGWNSEHFIELGNRLNAGSLLGDGRRLVTAVRTDYIGWEVDRFFRATKYALPSVVTVGRTLFERTFRVPQHPDQDVGGTGLMKTVLRCPIQQQGSARFEHCFRYVPKDLTPKDLKGVGEGYSVYRVLRKYDLLGLHCTSADKKIMKHTFKVFTRVMERAERAAP